MEIKRYEGTGRMSRAVAYNNTLYLCGQTAGEAGDDIGAQTASVLAKVEALLDKYGSDKLHILSATIYLKDISLFQGMNAIWDNWVVSGSEPVRACVEAKLAADSILVEMSIVAALKD